MQLTFIYGAMTMGGIETLLVRLANLFVGKGQSVRLLCQDGELTEELSGAVETLVYRDWAEARRLFGTGGSDGNPNLVVSFDPTSCALASWLLGRAGRTNVTHITGVYHPRAWFLEDDWLRLMINRMLLRTIQDDQIYFINAESRIHHAEWAERGFTDSTVLPLGVRTHDRAPERFIDGTIRIATVGRLVGFKDFNLHIPGIARQLIDDGVKLRWDVFGTGELKDDVERLIHETLTEDQVHLRGDLPYAQLGSTLSQYDIFVGMGTAAVEAATLGLPTIVAVDRGGERTYGFIQDLPFGNICEMMDQPPVLTIGSLLSDLIKREKADRAVIGIASRVAALRYSMEDYAAGLLSIGLKATSGPYRKAAIAGLLYGEATIGRTRRLVQTGHRALRRTMPKAV